MLSLVLRVLAQDDEHDEQHELSEDEQGHSGKPADRGVRDEATPARHRGKGFRGPLDRVDRSSAGGAS